jgi:hypothetical protein
MQIVPEIKNLTHTVNFYRKHLESWGIKLNYHFDRLVCCGIITSLKFLL